MAYLIDRGRVLRLGEVVALISVRQPGVRSRVVLRDNSLHHTLTRPRTFIGHAARTTGLRLVGARRRRKTR